MKNVIEEKNRYEFDSLLFLTRLEKSEINRIREKITAFEVEKSEGDKEEMFKEIVKKFHEIHKEMEMLLSYMEKESKKYDISWELSEIIGKCPFCGSDLHESKKTETIEEAFEIIVSRHGKRVFAESKKFIGLLEYYAPYLEKERNLVKTAVETGAYRAMYEAGKELEQKAGKLIADYVQQMNKEYFIDESWAKKALDWCFTVLKSKEILCDTISEEHAQSQKTVFEELINYEKLEKTPANELSISNGKLIKYNGKRAVVVIPEGVSEIYSRAFYANDRVSVVVLPKGVTVVGEKSFAYCSNLEQIQLPEGIKEIKSGAFEGCKSLKEIVIPEQAIVSPDAFEQSTTKKSYIKKVLREPIRSSEPIIKNVLNVGNSWKIEGSGWSLDSNQVLTVKHMNYVETYEQKLTRKGQWNKAVKVILCEGITEIEREFFSRMKNLQQIVFPTTLKKIGYASFQGCEKLNSISIPEGVTMVSSRAFEECKNLEKVKLPSTMKYIGDRAFTSRCLQKTLAPWGCVVCPGNYNIRVGR